jgi:hypothetical protein
MEETLNSKENYLSKYLSLNLEPNSPLVRELMEKLEEDLAVVPISLRKEHEEPSYCTPAMYGWFQARIATTRRNALSAIRSAFVSAHRNQNLQEVARDEAILQAAEARRNVLAHFCEARSREAGELRTARDAYEQLKFQQNGREAKPIRPVRELLVLTVLAIPELLMNFTTFTKVEWLNPALAAGACMAIALMVGFASHIHGRYLQQWGELLGPHKHKEERRKHIWLLCIATAGLLIALVFVAYGRYWLLAAAIREAEIMGTSVLGAYWMLAGSVLGNVLVWLIGLLYVYQTTDPVPDFSEKRRDFEKAKRKYEQLYEREVQQELDRISAQLALRLKQGSPQYEPFGPFESFKAKDSEVVGVLNRYRNELCIKISEKIRQQGPAQNQHVFVLQELDPDKVRGAQFPTEVGNDNEQREQLYTRRVYLDCHDYLQREIRLRYS